jgi:hypothetical protein
MLGFVVVVESWIGRHEDHAFTTNVAQSWKFAGQAARQFSARCAILSFGDSMIKFGIHPRVLEARLGRPALNLSAYAGTPATSYVLLRQALAAGARPSAVVVDFQPGTLGLTLRGQVRVWQELASVSDAIDLAWTSRDAAFLPMVVLGRFVPSIRDRFEIRASVLAALGGGSYTAMVSEWVTPSRRNWWRNLGAEAGPKNPGFDGHLGPTDEWLFPDPRSRDPVMLIYLKRYLALAAARGITVYWLLPPVAPEAQARFDRQGLTAEFNRFVSAAQALFPNLVVLDARHSGYRHTVFQNPSHLDLEGAFALSADLAAVLQSNLPATPAAMRWIELPLYHKRSIFFPLEDVNQSRIALKSTPRG